MSKKNEYPHKFNSDVDNQNLTSLTYWSLVSMFVDTDRGDPGGIRSSRERGRLTWRASCEGRLKEDIGPVPAGTYVFADIFGDEVELRYNAKIEPKFPKKVSEEEEEESEEEGEEGEDLGEEDEGEEIESGEEDEPEDMEDEYIFHIEHKPVIILPKSRLI